MSNQSNAKWVSENPAHIVKVELSRSGKAKDGKPIINVYEKTGMFPAFSVKERDFFLFTRARFDVDALEEGNPARVDLSVKWQLDTKDGKPSLNKDGNQYKSAVSITNNAQQTAADNSAQLDKIEAMLEYLIAHIASNGDTAATPAPTIGSRIIVQGNTEQRAMKLTRWGPVEFEAEVGGTVYKLPIVRYIGAAGVA